MAALRQFIYLDEYKLTSLSSQLFEGFTESVRQYTHTDARESEEQKGPIGSGRVVADLVTRRVGQEERRVLHDHAYSLLEDELTKKELLQLHGPATDESQGPTLGSFVKVTGYTEFNDMKVIRESLAHFNQLGTAMTYAQTHADRVDLAKQAADALDTATDRNQRARIKAAAKAAADIKTIAQKRGLQQDPQLLEHLSELLNFGYGDQFELQIRPWVNQPAARWFSAILKREALREDETIVVRRYGRRAQRPFSMVGIVSQIGDHEAPETQQEQDPTHMKAALRNIVFAYAGMETTFTGCLKGEVIVDPIAVYGET